MAKTETLSVRVSPETRRVLEEAAATHEAAGASALARAILERWAAAAVASRRDAGIERAVSFLAGHPEGWDDDPAGFFPGLSDLR